MQNNKEHPPITPDSIRSLTFEEALQELQNIVSQLEDGAIDLNRSVELYEKGQILRTHCDNLLKNAEEKIEKITMDKQANHTKEDITNTL